MTSDVGHRDGSAGAATLRTAESLRWRKPQLTAELAQQVLGDAAAGGDDALWWRAAGWFLHGRAAIGDAREAALDLVAGPGAPGWTDPADTARWRLEWAGVAQANGDLDAALRLAESVADGDPSDEFELDRLAVLLRCALARSGTDVAGLRRRVERLGERLRGEPAALADLLVGSAYRADGNHQAAVERALRGLDHLGWHPERPGASPTSPHLGSALFSQWITALLDSGAPEEVASAVRAVRGLPEQPDGGRQGVLFRLTMVRAAPEPSGRTVEALRDIADRAAWVGASSLESVCRATEAELHEKSGDYREALFAMRAGRAAERADQECGDRFRTALAQVVAGQPGAGRDGRSMSGRRSQDRAAARQLPAGTGHHDPRHADPLGTPDDHPGVVAGVPGVAAGNGVAAENGVAVSAHRNGHRADSNGERHGAIASHRRPANGVSAGPLPPLSQSVTRPSDEVHDPDGAGSHLLEWVERSWYGPGAPESGDDGAAGSGSPLADALVAELRAAAAGGPATPSADEPEPGSALDRARPDDKHSSAERPRQEPWNALIAPSVPILAPEPEDGPGAAGDRSRPAGPRHGAANGSGRPATDGARTNGWGIAGRAGAPSGPPAEPVQQGRFVVVLDLEADGRSVGGASGVLHDVAERAGRLVPPSGEVREVDGWESAGPDPVGAGSAEQVQVILPEADRVTALLWAQSLVGHVAVRVAPDGLPDGTLLRSRVHGPSGPVGDAVRRALSGPPASRDLLSPPSGDAGAAPGSAATGPTDERSDPLDAVAGTGRRRHGGSDPDASMAGWLTARPGSGGRRRRGAAADTDAGSAPLRPAYAETAGAASRNGRGAGDDGIDAGGHNGWDTDLWDTDRWDTAGRWHPEDRQHRAEREDSGAGVDPLSPAWDVASVSVGEDTGPRPTAPTGEPGRTPSGIDTYSSVAEMPVGVGAGRPSPGARSRSDAGESLLRAGSPSSDGREPTSAAGWRDGDAGSASAERGVGVAAPAAAGRRDEAAEPGVAERRDAASRAAARRDAFTAERRGAAGSSADAEGRGVAGSSSDAEGGGAAGSSSPAGRRGTGSSSAAESRRGTGSSSSGPEGRGTAGPSAAAEGRAVAAPAEPDAIPENLGLGDLLAGALAAYRDI